MNIYNFIKKVSAIGAVTVWLILLYKIFKSGGGFHNQLPKCLFATMGIFTILTLIYKSVEYLEAQKLSKSKIDTDSQREDKSE